MTKIFLSFIFFGGIFLLFPQSLWAKVVINEFLSNPSEGENDWVELYNTGEEAIDLEGWVLDDEGTTTNMAEIHEEVLPPRSFLFIEVSDRLNQDEDTVYLRNKEEGEEDSFSYDYNPGTDVSFGRVPDGGSWGICSVLTKGFVNQCSLPTPTPTPTSTPTPEPEDTPTPTPEPEDTPTPTPTLRPTATPTKKPTMTPTPTPSLIPSEGEILGSRASPSAEPTEVMESTEEGSSPFFLNFPLLLIGLGFLFLSSSAALVLIPKFKGKKKVIEI